MKECGVKDHYEKNHGVMDRPRIAFLTPLKPLATGIADYSEDLLPALAAHCDVDVYTSDGLTPSTKAIAESFDVLGYSQLPRQLGARRYDQVVVQLGNSGHHVECCDILTRHGGIAVMHDLNLSGIVGAKTLPQRDIVGFFREMLRGEDCSATARVIAKFVATRQLPGPHDWWMNRGVLRKSAAIVVHNEYAAAITRSALQKMGKTTRVWKVTHGVPTRPAYGEADVARVRIQLGLDRFGFVVGSFGVLDESKRLTVALLAFARLVGIFPNAVYVLVGEDSGGYRATVNALGLADRVRLTGHVDRQAFHDYIVACDLCISLRYPSHGESSAALLHQMSVGKPSAITNHAQFREYPEGTCLKIDLGPAEEENLCTAMHEIAVNRERRATIGERARQYIVEHHSIERAARGYYDVIQSTATLRGAQRESTSAPVVGRVH